MDFTIRMEGSAAGCRAPWVSLLPVLSSQRHQEADNGLPQELNRPLDW